MRRIRWVDTTEATQRPRASWPRLLSQRSTKTQYLRLKLLTAVALFSSSANAWSQTSLQQPFSDSTHTAQNAQVTQDPTARPKTSKPQISVASFSKNPIFSVAPKSTIAQSAIRASEQPTPSSISLHAVSHASDPQQPVPTILDGTSPVTVSLEFLIMSSLATRKAMLSFNGGVVIEPTTYFDFDISNQAKQIALSQFDPNVAAFLIGNDINRPDNSFFGPGLQQQNKIDEMEFNTRLSKNWANGMISSIGYEPSLAYLFFPQGNPGAFNPTHSSDLVTRIEQPLLRGAGRTVNLVNLRVVEWKAQQSLCQIEASIQTQLRSIEQVYWKLHAEYVRLRAIDTVITLSQKTLDVVRARYDAERVIYSDVARAEVKLEDLFQQRLAAELAIREASFALAQLSGLELDETMLLVPTNSPEFSPPQVNQEEIVASAISFNPNLKRQRQAIEIARQTICGAQNNVLPKLNLQAAHRTSGLEDDLGTSLKQMASFQFNDFSMGLQYTQQLGIRQARSQLTTARLQIAREQAILDALERNIGFDILQQINKLNQIYERYQSALRQVEQSKKWVQIARTRYEDPPVSTVQQESILVTLVDYQAALQSQIDSIVLVANALADYNTALAVIDERRGVLMNKWGISTNGCGQVVGSPSSDAPLEQTHPDQGISPSNSNPTQDNTTNRLSVQNAPQTTTSPAINPQSITPQAKNLPTIASDQRVSQANYSIQQTTIPQQPHQQRVAQQTALTPTPQQPQIAPQRFVPPLRNNGQSLHSGSTQKTSGSATNQLLLPNTTPVKPFVPPLHKSR